MQTIIQLPPISVFQPRGQCITLLLAALNEIGGSATKRETVQFISDQEWFDRQPEDWKPYPSQKTSREPRWQTLIAWARKDSVLREFLIDGEWDSWALSREGRRLWASMRIKFESGEWPVARGYLWSPKFKRRLCFTYQPSTTDPERPPFFYRDIGLERFIASLST
jgi:hypothetical protein